MVAFTGDRDGHGRVEDKTKGGIAGWFSGSSAPVSLGLSVNDEGTMESPPSSTTGTQGSNPRRRPTIPSYESPASPTKSVVKDTAISRLNSFFTKPVTPKPNFSVNQPSDEFLNLDIQTALFPTGAPHETDPFSPSAFKNLLQNAEGLLTRLQAAYVSRTMAVTDLTAETSAQAEELEEAETRTAHLKMQLEDMARRVTEQDQAIAALGAQLAIEKQARAEEAEARLRSLALIKQRAGSVSGESEDLEVETRRRRRGSDHTTESSRMSFDSGDESSQLSWNHNVSGWNRRSTIDDSEARFDSVVPTPEICQAAFMSMSKEKSPLTKAERPAAVERQSTFQKVLDARREKELEIAGCLNCSGAGAGEAWDVVKGLRGENRGLKERVVELEEAVDGALEVVRVMGE